MDHSWRPHPPIQGNICPTCSISHFPFCPPRFHEPNQGPINMARPIYNGPPSDPYHHDPGYWNRNPSLPQMGDIGNVNRGPYMMHNNHGYNDSGYDLNVNDNRSSKRLRVDDGGYYSGSYGGEGVGLGDGNVSNALKLVRDHGGPGFDGGFSRDVRGYVQESSGFDRNVDEGRERGSLGNMGIGNNLGVGYGGNYQREELGFQSGYGSHHGVKRSVSDVQHGSLGGTFQNHEHQLSHYGHVGKTPEPMGFRPGGAGHDIGHSSYGSSHVPSGSFYSNNFEPMRPSDNGLHYEQRGNMSNPMPYPASQPPLPNTMQPPGHMRYDHQSPSRFNDVRQPFEARARPIEGYQSPLSNQNLPMRTHYGPPTHMGNQGGYGTSVSENLGQLRASQGSDFQPPLPASPPPPLPMEPPGHWSANHGSFSPPKVSSSLFPVPISSAAAVHSSYPPTPDSSMRTHQHPQHSHLPHPSRSMFQRDSQAALTSSGHHLGEGQPFPSKSNFPDKPKIIDASHLIKPPHRATRPDHFVIILRGLPGSGKSYLAKMLRDLEVEHGGRAPRIHSMDDYFMTEVEKADENEASKSSVRGKKPSMRTVLEYCYEPEMEEAYRASMLKAFKKTLEEGVFTFVIVDDRNLRVADFAQFWATAKRSGYEVYMLEAPYKDPAGCTARNVHGFTQDDVEKMAAQWEEAPSLYLQLGVKSLFHGDDLNDSNIEEVDMDTEDGDFDGNMQRLEEREPEKISASSVSPKDERSYRDAEDDNPTEVKDLGRSKWSSILDEEDNERTEVLKGKRNVPSGSIRKYRKEGKCVHWGDQGGHTGFSIGAVKKANVVSLVIGPGAGYNLKSNPLPEEAQVAAKSGETKKHSVFKERLRAEQESFRVVFDRRRQRIGGLDAEEE